MVKMNFRNQFMGSVFKTEYYSAFIKQSTGKAVLYVVLLIFIASLSFGIKLSVAWNDGVNTIRTQIQTKSPDFIFTGGELAVKAPMPYVIHDTKEIVIVVDTSGKTNEQVLNGREKGLFIGKNKVIDKMSQVETRTYDLSKIKDITFTKADVVQVIPLLKWFNIILVISLFIFGIISNLFAALIVASCGWIVSKMMSYKIIFADLYKISIHALTLPLVLEMIKDLSGAKISFFGLAFYIISIGYVVKVLLSLKKQRKIVVHIDEMA